MLCKVKAYALVLMSLISITSFFTVIADDPTHKPGMIFSVPPWDFFEAKYALGEIIVAAVNNISVDGMDDIVVNVTGNDWLNGSEINGNSFHIDPDFPWDQFELEFIPEEHKFIAKINGGVNGFWHSDYIRIGTGIERIEGQVDVSDYDASIEAGIQFSTANCTFDWTAEDGPPRWIDYLLGVDCKVHFNPKTIDLKIDYSSPIAHIIDDLAPIIEPFIIKVVDVELASFMCTNMMTVPNRFLASHFGYRRPFFSTPFMDQLEFDFSVNPGQATIVGPPYFLFQYKGGVGQCVPTCAPEYMSKDCFKHCDRTTYNNAGSENHDLPTRTDLSTSEVQVFVGEFFGSTFMNSLNAQNKDRVLFFLDAPSMGGTFDTETLNYAFPGIFQYFGSVDKDCNLTFRLGDIYNWSMLPEIEAVNVFADGYADLYVLDHNLDGSDFLAASFYIRNMNISFEVGIGLENVTYEALQNDNQYAHDNDTYLPRQILFPQAKNFSVEAIEQTYSTWGDVNEEFLLLAFNTLMWNTGYLFNTINASFKESIKFAVPWLIFGYFEVTDIQVVYGDVWLMLGFTPRFPMLNGGGGGPPMRSSQHAARRLRETYFSDVYDKLNAIGERDE